MKLLLAIGLVAAMFSCMDQPITTNPGYRSVPPQMRQVEVERTWDLQFRKQYCMVLLPEDGELGFYTTRAAMQASKDRGDGLSSFFKTYNVAGQEFVSYFPLRGLQGRYTYYPQDNLTSQYSKLLFRSRDGSIWVLDITDAMRNPGSGKTKTIAYVYTN